MIKRILLALVAVLLLAACGEKKEAIAPTAPKQSLTLMLDWFPNADHVGIYQAQAEGDFSRAGLNVHLEVPSNPASPLQLLAAGKVDAAVSYEPEVLLARSQNLQIASVAAIVQQPLTSIISIGKHAVTSVAQLRGKTIGDAGIPYQHAYLQTILDHAGVPTSSVKEINVGDNLIPALLSGRVSAILGGYWNYEAVQLAQMRKHPHVLRVNQLGVPAYDELVLAVRTSTLAKQPDLIRRLVQALGRGYESARANPAAAVSSLVGANPGLDRHLQQASVMATLPAFFPSHSGEPWGWQDPTQWNAYGQWMLSHHLISEPAAVTDASTNEELSGQGL